MWHLASWEPDAQDPVGDNVVVALAAPTAED
jgi:hypothetical protein